MKVFGLTIIVACFIIKWFCESKEKINTFIYLDTIMTIVMVPNSDISIIQ